VSDSVFSAIIGAVIGAVAALVVLALTLWRESKHRREDAERALAYRREQYFVESSADLATRVWDAIRTVEGLEAEKTVPWEEIYGILLNLSVELQGQAPRYRLAGVDKASDEILVQLRGHLGARAEADGRANANRTLYRSMIDTRAPSGTPETQVEDQVRAEIGFDETDVDRALERFRRETFEQMRDRVYQVLQAVSKYNPGQPFELQKDRKPYTNFSEMWAAVTMESKVDESAGS
jgi:MoxR-like ATPase